MWYPSTEIPSPRNACSQRERREVNWFESQVTHHVTINSHAFSISSATQIANADVIGSFIHFTLKQRTSKAVCWRLRFLPHRFDIWWLACRRVCSLAHRLFPTHTPSHSSIYANRAWVGFGVCAARAPKSLSAGTLIGNRSGPADRHTMDPVRRNAQSSNQWRANSCCSHGVGYFDSHRRSPVCLIDWIGRHRRP